MHEHLRPAAAAAAAQGKPLPIVLFAHGGLVKESTGLSIAQHHVGWWLDNGVYPIHFVWETGLFESIKSLLERAGSPLRQRGLDELITDKLTDPLIESLVRTLQAERIWGGMKASAQLASEAGGGAHALLQALAAFIGSGANVELHAVGHSAGSIFHAHLLQAARALGLPAFTSLQLLAPAVRADTFRSLTEPLLGPGNGVDALTVYTMRRDFERDDDCAGIYRKSPLATSPRVAKTNPTRRCSGSRLAARRRGPVRAVRARPARQRECRGRLVEEPARRRAQRDALGPPWRLRRRRADHELSAAPRARHRRRDAAGQALPAAATRSAADPWRDSVDWPRDLQLAAAAPMPMPALVAAAAPSGGRQALCVGIDNYPTAPLAGCQNDARLWQRTLQGLGFETELLLDPTRSDLHGAIEHLFTSARAGDEVVIQYAGHGTQVDDLDGDEADGDTPGKDEALCPLDFAGALLIDDDLGALIDLLKPGARLTLFMDCCHSGSNTRFGGQPGSAPPDGARARVVRATPALREAHRRWRERNGNSVAVARGVHPELLFTACRSDQVAWESEGHGEFTLRATGVLAGGSGPFSARALHERVLAAFGPNARQQPLLDGPAERLDALLFGR